jgi:hypothetical protein
MKLSLMVIKILINNNYNNHRKMLTFLFLKFVNAE